MSYFDPAKMQPLGKHLVCVEGDSVFLQSRGLVTLDEMVELYQHFARARREHGMLFVLYDGRGNTGMDREARKIASNENSAHLRPDLQVIFGAPFVVRVLLDMLFRAQRLLNREHVRIELFETESQAEAYFNSERDGIRRELATKAKD